MAQGLTLLIKADKEVPEKYEELLAQRKGGTAYGVMYVDKDDGLSVFHNNSNVDKGSLKALREMLKTTCVVQIMDYPKTHMEEDLQPYPLLVDNEEVVLLATFEGDFSSWHKEDSAHLPFWHCCEDYLIPKINEINELVNGDVDKLVKALKAPSTARDITNCITTKGMITFMANNGDVWMAVQAEGKHVFEFDWGVTTDPLGFEKVGSAEHVPVLSKAEQLKAKMQAKNLSQPAAPPVPETPTEVPELTENDDELDESLPKESTEQLANWMKDHPGNPAAWPSESEGGPPLSYVDQRLASGKIEKIVKAFKKLADGYHPPPSVLDVWDPKDRLPGCISRENQSKYALVRKKAQLLAEQAANLGKPKEEHTVAKPASTVREPVPVLSAESKKRIMTEFMPTVFDQNGNRLPHDEKEVAAQYGRPHPLFTKTFPALQLKGVSQTMSWFYKDRLKLAQVDPEGSAILNQELTRTLREAWAELAALKGKQVTAEAPTAEAQLSTQERLKARLRKTA